MADANFEFIRRENVENLTRQLAAAPPGERRVMIQTLLDEERAKRYPLAAPQPGRPSGLRSVPATCARTASLIGFFHRCRLAATAGTLADPTTR